MSDIKLNDSWDIDVSGTDLVLTSGREAIAQHIAQRLKTFTGEWFMDTRLGIPYFQQVFKKQPNMTVLDTIFKSEIVNTPGVLELTAFYIGIDRKTRELSISFSARTEDGPVTVEAAIADPGEMTITWDEREGITLDEREGITFDER